MCYQPDGRNRRGRHKKKWRDNFREGLERYGLRDTETEDREQWKKRMKQTLD